MQASSIIALIKTSVIGLSVISLRYYLGHDSGADGLSAFPHREPYSLFHGYRGYKLDVKRHVVPRHHHLRAARKRRHSGNVGRSEVKLGTVSVKERRVAASLFLRKHIDLALELRVRGYRAGLRQYLTPLDVFFLRAPQEAPDVVSGASFVQKFPEHLDARDNGLLSVPESHYLDFFAYLYYAPLDPSGNDRASSGYRKYALDRHQKRLVKRPSRLGVV